MLGLPLESDTLMRVLLKCRPVIGPGALAEEVLQLAHSLHSLRSALADGEKTWFLAECAADAG